MTRAPQVQPRNGGGFQDHKRGRSLVALRPLVIPTHFPACRHPSLRADIPLVMTRNGAQNARPIAAEFDMTRAGSAVVRRHVHSTY